jgi:alanyl-tRNA synthetase
VHVTGKTEDDVQTVGGCFKFYATHGVPVPIIVDVLHANNMMVDWVDFCIESMKGKWTLGKAYTILREAVGDNYDPAWIAQWDTKMLGWCKLRARGRQ